MSQLFIRKTIQIDKDNLSVFKLINDFHHWPKWSPWLITDPNAVVKVDPDGKYYNWKSPILGSGEMRIIHEEKGQSINCELQFFKPWKSKAKVTFYLNSKNNQTEVVWTMKSSLPFYLFWMKKQMETFVAMDYERGLLLLKDFAENGKNMFKLNFEGVIPFEATHYYGFRRKTSYTKFKNKMASDFKKLMPYMIEHYKEVVSGSPFSIYHRFDIVKDKVDYTIGFPIKYPILTSHKEHFVKSFPKMKVHSVELIGSYKFLPNAWAAQMMHQRGKKLKHLKKVPPFEIYLNNPMDTPETKLKTKVLLPLR
jgi:hypothetical protein